MGKLCNLAFFVLSSSERGMGMVKKISGWIHGKMVMTFQDGAC